MLSQITEIKHGIQGIGEEDKKAVISKHGN